MLKHNTLIAICFLSLLLGCTPGPISDNSLLSIDSPEPQLDDSEKFGFKNTAETNTSTFSIDVDTASYSIARSYINSGSLPPTNTVRVEEFVNYFDYSYLPPQDEQPFAIHTESGAAPWASDHRLVKIGIKAKEIETAQRGPSNLVFLVDTSGSMYNEKKLPLLKRALIHLTEQLTADDRIAIVTYAGRAGVLLESTSGSDKNTIIQAINHMEAGGSTNGEAGILGAYKLASTNRIAGGVNRVILATDGDFNVGQIDPQALVDLIKQKAEGGIYLTALGFGQYSNDTTMEKLADNGNGNYAFIDNDAEAKKVLIEEINGTLVTVANDVKIQVEFDSTSVKEYRLIGYENRVLANEDYVDDKKDAGEIGAGHKVTAFYEIVLQDGVIASTGAALMSLKLRFKVPDSTTSTELITPVNDNSVVSQDYNFASAVAGFAMILADSPYKGSATYESILALAEANRGPDLKGYRQELIELVKAAQHISGG